MEVSYQYDGSFDGFLSCVFAVYAYKEIPAGFCSGEDLSLFDARVIITNPEHASRVLRKVSALSPDAALLLRHGFLTCLPEKEMHLFHLIAALLKDGPAFLRNRANDVLFPVARAVQHLYGEVHLLKGFTRFSDYSGVLGGEIQPKNRVLPLLGGHFRARLINDPFFLYDRTHQEAVFHTPGENLVLRPLEYVQAAPPSPEEAQFRRLWKQFYDTVAIRERYNPRCRMSQMPKRYWGMMTEFQGEAYFKPQSSPEAVSAPGVPGGIPAPATPPPLGPSVPASIL